MSEGEYRRLRPLCQAADCGKPHAAKGLCANHYAKLRASKTLCSIEGCESFAHSTGLCQTHYSRKRLHGDPYVSGTVFIKDSPCSIEGCVAAARQRWKGGALACGAHIQMLRRYGQVFAPEKGEPEPMPLCKVAKCGQVARGRNTPLCEKHYGRVRRGADLEKDRVALNFYIRKEGYRILSKQEGHPLADSDGRVAEHRMVLYEASGGVCPPCSWCGKPLAWDTLVVDHLNEQKADNRPENLKGSCNPCNRARGAVLDFIKRLTPEGFVEFVKQADNFWIAEYLKRQAAE